MTKIQPEWVRGSSPPPIKRATLSDYDVRTLGRSRVTVLSIISLLIVLSLSLSIVRVATISLVHTGLSRQAAKFQARSAFTGVGFATAEAEKVVNHPVRRRILMLLMLLGNAGIVTVVASLMVTFVEPGGEARWWLRILLLAAGITVLWMIASSAWVDRQMNALIERLLARFTDLDVRDYAGLLHLADDYAVVELDVEADNWVGSSPLTDLRLTDEGILVLGLYRRDGRYLGTPTGSTLVKPGDTLILYGSAAHLAELNTRKAGPEGDDAHEKAVVETEARRQREAAEVGDA